MKTQEYSGILVYLENRDGQILSVGPELIGEAIRLSRISGEQIYGIGIGNDIKSIREQMKGYPLEELYLYQTDDVFQADCYEVALEECINIIKPSIVLIGGTAEGRALAPRIAVAFRTGLTADCTQLEINENNHLVQIRPAFGGNIMASILTEQTRPQIATVRPGMFAPVVPDVISVGQKSGAVIEKELHFSGRGVELIEINKPQVKPGIAQQELLIVAGRGVKKREDLDMLRDLAKKLGGTLASSRALVEKGWMKPEEQIGLSGTTVSPKCMITFGVSGTVQFAAGMKNTTNIIAVNTDPKARIFEIAHVPICADLYEVITELLK